MNRMTLPLLVFIFLLLQACASGVTVLDTAGVDKQQLEEDMTQCREYADELDNSDVVLQSALLGGFLAGVTEWVFSGGDEDFARGAAFVGALEGGAIAATELEYEKDEIVKNCLHHRGYIVLN